MDLDRHDELLSAYLDRELSPDERVAVDRLLERSPEARQRLQELDGTIRFVRSIPPQRPEGDTAEAVMDRLRQENLLRPTIEAPVRTRHRLVWWAGTSVAAAAAVTLAVWVGRGPQIPDAADGMTRELASLPLANAPAGAPADPRVLDESPKPGDVVPFEQYTVTVLDVESAVDTIQRICVASNFEFSDAKRADTPLAANESQTVLEIVGDYDRVKGLLAEVARELPDQLHRYRVNAESRAPDNPAESATAVTEQKAAEQAAVVAARLKQQTEPAAPSDPAPSREAKLKEGYTKLPDQETAPEADKKVSLAEKLGKEAPPGAAGITDERRELDGASHANRVVLRYEAGARVAGERESLPPTMGLADLVRSREFGRLGGLRDEAVHERVRVLLILNPDPASGQPRN